MLPETKLTRKDFVSDQAVRWCPGCGDYAILAQLQRVLPELGIPKENIVFVSGIGCSSRFPYYMDTYGIHSIHGRAPTLATGMKIANPDLHVWVITGDGDGLSIGGNHLLHTIRRNVDMTIVLFNNRIYGLTKGQYSPTSLPGTRTKSTPMGSIEQSFNPLSVAIGAEATFVARTIATEVKHMAEILKRAAEHKGTSFVEVYQNCLIFNDGTWEYATDAQVKKDHILELEHGKPLIFGKNRDKGICLRGLDPVAVSITDPERDRLLIHNEFAPEPSLAYLLSRMRYPEFPEPIGVFRCVEKPTYEGDVLRQIQQAKEKKGDGDLAQLYRDAEIWEVRGMFDLYLEGRARREEKSETELLIHSKLADLGPKKPLIFTENTSLAEVIGALQKLNVGFAAIVDEAGNLAGVFTEGDVFTKVACLVEDLAAAKVKDYMTRAVTTLKPTDTIAYALHYMSLQKFRHILLVDEAGKPSGVLSFRAVARYIEDKLLSTTDEKESPAQVF